MKQRQVLLGSLIYYLVVTLFLIFSNGLIIILMETTVLSPF
jgi:hypothetical protein